MAFHSWHYPRPELAAKYLKAFELGLVAARGLFARRRMGKTEFLKQDLLPAAAQQGYSIAYANLWETREDPAQALLPALCEAIEPKGMAKLLQQFRRPPGKLKASAKLAGVAEAGLEAELTAPARLARGTLLMEAMAAYDRKPVPLLLVIDEAQVLAGHGNADFAHALRAALDVRKDGIKVIFAGSSEATLRRMFGRASEPFYNWAPLEPFELLGEEFVRAMVDKVAALSTHPLPLQDALNAYAALKNTPEFFRNYLDRYLTHAFEGPAAALHHTQRQVFNHAGFARQWEAMLPADQALLSLIAAGARELLGKQARARVGEALGLGQAVSAATLTNSMRRLCAKGVLTRMEVGDYRFEDEAFAEWVVNRELED
jgi:hypothetical protein